MTLEEQLEWLPRAEAIERELIRIFGVGTVVEILWNEKERWEDADRRIRARNDAAAARRWRQNGMVADSAVPERAVVVAAPQPRLWEG